MGKPKLACEVCGLDYQSEAAVKRHIRQKHNGKARVITYNKLLASINDGLYIDHLVGRPAKTPSSGLDVARIMQQELTLETARIIGSRILYHTLDNPEILAPGLRALLADYIATLRYVFGDESNLNLPSSRIKNDEAVQKNFSISADEFIYWYTLFHAPKHKTSMGKPDKTKRIIEDPSVPDLNRPSPQDVVQGNLSNYPHATEYKISAKQPDSVNRLIEDLYLNIKKEQTVDSLSIPEDEKDSHT